MNGRQKCQRKIIFDLSLIAIGAIIILMISVSISESTCTVGSVAVDKKASKVEYEKEQNVTMQAEQTQSKHMMKIKGISQEGIPTGCEAVSAVTVLNYLGVKISPEKFIDTFLEKESFYYVGDKLYGANPEEKFAGDPYDRFSLGCYPPVIARAIENMKEYGYKGSKKIETKIINEMSLEDICKEYVTNNIPVLVWVTIDMSEPKQGASYYFADGTRYTWTSGEHCMVICGWDEDNYYFKDPLSEGKTVRHGKELAALRYEQMGRRALAIFKK